MKKILLLSFAFSSALSTFAQDSLYSKVYYVQNGYKSLALDVDGNSNIAQVGYTNYNDAAFSYLDSLGNILSSSQYTIDGQPANSFEFRDVTALSDGNFLAVGTVQLQNFGVNVGVVAKLTSTGTVVWSKGVYPQAPIYFGCSASLESSENTYWIAGSDDQSGEMVISELDTDGTVLDVWSYKNAGLRFKISDIIEHGSDTLVFSGYTLDNGGTAQGMVFSTDNTGTLLWNNVKPGYRFFQLEEDSSAIRIACSGNSNIGIASLTPSGNFTTLQETSLMAGGAENISIANIQDSTYALSYSDGFQSIIQKIGIGTAVRENFYYMGILNDLVERENKGLYISGFGPIYGVKSLWFPDPHGNLVRTDSTLSLGNCGNSYGSQTETIGMLSNSTMSFTSVTDASIMDLLINQTNCALLDSISCVDFYSGINEENAELITLYPNPASEKVSIHFNTLISGKLRFMDSKGQIVLETEVNENTELNVSALAGGIYFYELINSNNQVKAHGKLIKN